MVANGVTYRTFVNSRGQYRIPVTLSGTPQILVGGLAPSIATVGSNINLFVN